MFQLADKLKKKFVSEPDLIRVCKKLNVGLSSNAIKEKFKVRLVQFALSFYPLIPRAGNCEESQERHDGLRPIQDVLQGYSSQA